MFTFVPAFRVRHALGVSPVALRKVVAKCWDDEKPSSLSWMPFGGGVRRCIGASFANMEMDVVLRTVLRNFTIETTDAPGEKWHSRGVAYTPKKGGRVVMRRRV